MATKKQEPKTKVLLSIPKGLLKRIDSVADAQRRDRSAEVCLRLQSSLAKPKKSGVSA